MPDVLVRIILIDDATDVVIGDSEVAADSLPDSFVSDTLLHIGDQDWSVAEAEPLSRKEYLKSRHVVLRLRRVEHRDASKILFSLPTICEPVPETEGPLLEGRELLLHEDDWRQVELISRSLEPVVDEEIPQVTKILAESRTADGFRDIHVRKRIEHPLQGVGLTLERLREILRETQLKETLGEIPESRVVLPDSSQCVTHSFSFFLTRELVLYGLHDEGVVAVLAVKLLGDATRLGDKSVPNLSWLRDLASEYNLLAVDWCRGLKAGASDSNFESLGISTTLNSFE